MVPGLYCLYYLNQVDNCLPVMWRGGSFTDSLPVHPFTSFTSFPAQVLQLLRLCCHFAHTTPSHLLTMQRLTLSHNILSGTVPEDLQLPSGLQVRYGLGLPFSCPGKLACASNATSPTRTGCRIQGHACLRLLVKKPGCPTLVVGRGVLGRHGCTPNLYPMRDPCSRWGCPLIT